MSGEERAAGERDGSASGGQSTPPRAASVAVALTSLSESAATSASVGGGFSLPTAHILDANGTSQTVGSPGTAGHEGTCSAV